MMARRPKSTRAKRTPCPDPTTRWLIAKILRVVGTPEADEMIAELEAVGLKNWATYTRNLHRDKDLGPRTNAWEEQHIDPRGVWLDNHDAAQQFVNQLWADLGYADPPVVTPLTTDEIEERRHLVASANEKEIRLRWDRALDTVIIHEAAHVIVKRLGIDDFHGPNWFGVYLWLLARMPERFDMAGLKASAAAAGLEWAPLPSASDSLMA
jgi:hypothetical protein